MRGVCLKDSLWADLTPATREQGAHMTSKEKLTESITRLLKGFDKSQLKIIYQFILHLTK